eukprot:9495776-Pyramimonas_sp.AAC.1
MSQAKSSVLDGWIGPPGCQVQERLQDDLRTSVFKPMLLYVFHCVEDVPSKIVMFGSLQGALGAILGAYVGSHFFILKHFKCDVKTILIPSHVAEHVPIEVHMFCRVLLSGQPCCRSFNLLGISLATQANAKLGRSVNFAKVNFSRMPLARRLCVLNAMSR